MKPNQTSLWHTLDVGARKFLPADHRRSLSLRASASSQGLCLGRKFSVAKGARGKVAGVWVERTR